MRRLAGIQIDDMLKSRVAKLELESANIQFELALTLASDFPLQRFDARTFSIACLMPLPMG
jgi:hypothetical protein